MSIRLLMCLGICLCRTAPALSIPPQPWTIIEETIGAKGSMQPGDVFKIAQPRSDLNVTRGVVRVASTLALTSWMAFKEVDGGRVVVHGDLCLREGEVNPVMSRLQQGGIETTALHNHISGEQPRVMFLHFWGRGEAKPLAETLRAALELAGGIQSPPKPADGTLNQEELESILGQKAKLTAGVVQFGVPRPFPIRMHGVVLPPAMGMATAINFQPTPSGAAATGDFVLREHELAAVLETLRANGIEVCAVHNHMLDDDPRMVFVHFWGEGNPTDLARALRAALDTLNSNSVAGPKDIKRWDFEDSNVNSLPSYVDAPRGQWQVEEVADAPRGSKTLVQIAKSPRPYFNLAVIKDASFKDLRLTVKYKPLSGYVDQGGGLVWRYQDADNYYIARANPLENNFRVYRVVRGNREMLGTADVTVETGKWHNLSVTMRGYRIACELDGRKYLEVQDETFKDPGRVGVWTKADANTAFDELTVEPFDGNVEHR